LTGPNIKSSPGFGTTPGLFFAGDEPALL